MNIIWLFDSESLHLLVCMTFDLIYYKTYSYILLFRQCFFYVGLLLKVIMKKALLHEGAVLTKMYLYNKYEFTMPQSHEGCEDSLFRDAQ